MIRVLLALVALLSCAGGGAASELPRVAPEARGFDSARLADVLDELSATWINSLLVIRGGDVVLDAHFHPYDGRTVHDLGSVTKSVLTALVGIAAGEGLLDLDRPVLSYFPGRQVANGDARKQRILVRHLASMASGLACRESPGEPTLDEMRASEDWVQFVLDLPMAAEPGSVFAYCSPGMHLLSAVLQAATGRPAVDYAREVLFAPLGIEEALWVDDPAGRSRGWGDLHLAPHDMAKLGLLWLRGGEWDGRQVVPRAWVEATSRAVMETGRDEDYSYGWWVSRPGQIEQVAAIGRGGQRISIFPALDIVVVTTGSNFDAGHALDLLAAALLPPGASTQPDAAGAARLAAAIEAAQRAPQPVAVAPLPDIAGAVSGVTYALDPNPLALSTLRLDFPGDAEARLTIGFPGGRLLVHPVGLDGVYRISPGEYGLPVGVKGAWEDGVFTLGYDTIVSIEVYRFEVRFDGESVALEVSERVGPGATTITGSRLR